MSQMCIVILRFFVKQPPDPYDVISSLLEKDNIIHSHCFKNKEHGFMNNQL